MKPRILDLFCCGGGATRGYLSAGFDVTGVDIVAQPNYPGTLLVMDAIEAAWKIAGDFDAIHASPPCQGYSPHVTSGNSNCLGGKPMLIAAVREALVASGKPFVIENVMGASRHLKASLLLCGSMFGLHIPRHRIFESNTLIPQPHHGKCAGIAKKGSKILGYDYRDMSVTGKGRRAGTSERWKTLLGIEGDMTQHQLAEAIPPAYTEYIGKHLISFL